MYTILLAENEELRKGLETNFPEECRFLMEKDLPALFSHLKSERADLVLVDLDLPGCRHPEAVAQLQRFSQTGTVLFLADQEVFDASHPMTAVSAADYLLRPFREQELVLTVENVLYQCSKKKQMEDDSVRLRLVREKIEEYIRDHYSQDLSMQGVAQIMNYSETHFCRLFKQCFKVNFSAYLNEFRIEQARKMLLNTNATAKEIAIACGYQDNSYFIRVFKRFTGMTPVDYRIQVQSITRKKSNES